MLYYGLHSLLAADVAKAAVRAVWPGGCRYYRLFYILFSILGLIFLLLLVLKNPGQLLVGPRPYSGSVFLLAGVLLLAAAFRNYDVAEFLGLDAVSGAAHSVLQTSGLNAWVRHPLYSGVLCLVPGFALAFPFEGVWVSLLALLLYLPIGIYLEERKLHNQFGAAYSAYKKRVKAVIPRIL
jgi:protein-S-isoprenylcysteine O-methyltransferase Ste14